MYSYFCGTEGCGPKKPKKTQVQEERVIHRVRGRAKAFVDLAAQAQQVTQEGEEYQLQGRRKPTRQTKTKASSKKPTPKTSKSSQPPQAKASRRSERVRNKPKKLVEEAVIATQEDELPPDLDSRSGMYGLRRCMGRLSIPRRKKPMYIYEELYVSPPKKKKTTQIVQGMRGR